MLAVILHWDGARTLLDYFAHQQVRARAFDTEVPKGTLKRFHPDVTDVVDISYVPDQMWIFDTVNSAEASVTLIDIRAGLLSPTLSALRNIDFIDAAKKNHIAFVVFHLLGPTLASLDEIAETAAYLGDAKYFMVKNFINNTYSSSGTRRPTRPTSRPSMTRSRSRSRSSPKWRPSRGSLPRFRSRPSSPTRSRVESPPLIHSCSGARCNNGTLARTRRLIRYPIYGCGLRRVVHPALTEADGFDRKPQ